MRKLAAFLALALAACVPERLDLVVPDAAKTLILATDPDVAAIIALDVQARSGTLPDAKVMALFYDRAPDALGVVPGPLGDAHPTFPAPIAQIALADGASTPLEAIPEWLADKLDPPCPPRTSATVATATSSLELYGPIDGTRAFARIQRRLVTIDLDGNTTPATRDPLPPMIAAGHTDGVRIWLFSGGEGRILAATLDPEGSLVPIGPTGWPAAAGIVRHVDGARDPSGPADIVAATNEGWLLHFDGERWTVLYQPSDAIDDKEALLAWLGPDRTAFKPGLVGGPELFDVGGGEVKEIELPDRAGEPVSALDLGRDGALLIGCNKGHAYAQRPGEAPRTIGQSGGEITALIESDDQLWTFGPAGVVRISRRAGRVCPVVDGSAQRGRGSIAVLDGGVLFGDINVIYAVR